MELSNSSACQRIALPFHAAESSLPAPIPSKSDIEKSQNILLDYTGRKVVTVGKHFVVKYGLGVDLMEGENLLFVHRNTSIRVPRVYALFTDDNDGKNYLIMEYIAGERADLAWSTFTEPQKTKFSTILKGYFNELRSLPSPGGYCSIENRPLLDTIFWTDKNSESLSGPFETQAHLNEALIAKYSYNHGSARKTIIYRQAFASLLCNHHPTFTHGDLQSKNIILVRSPSGSPESRNVDLDYFEVALIDWEFAGWYPSYWEFCRALFPCGRWDDDWGIHIPKILDPYWAEWPLVNMLTTELWS
jgi:hypothetical protein